MRCFLGARARHRQDDRGAVAVIVAIFLVVFMVLLAFVVDLGRVYAMKAQLQNAADAGALAGAAGLPSAVTGSCTLWTSNGACIYTDNNGVPNTATTVISPFEGDECSIWVQTTGYTDFVFGQFVGLSGSDVATEAVGQLACTTVYTIFGKQRVTYNGQGSQGDSIYAGQEWKFNGNNPDFAGIYVEPGGDFTWGANYTPPSGVEHPDTEPLDIEVYYQALIDAGIAPTVPTAPATVPDCDDLTSADFVGASDVYCADGNGFSLNLDPCKVVAPKIAVDGDFTVGSGNVIAAGMPQVDAGLHITLASNRTLFMPSAATPGQVTGLTATTGSGQVVLNWTAVSATPTVTEYQVDYRAGTTGSWTTLSETTKNDTTATVGSLTNGTSYEFRVRAKNGTQGNDIGAWSATVTATPKAAPGAPTLAAASNLAPTSVDLSWTASGSGGAVASFTVQYRTPASTGTWTDATTGLASSATTYQVTGLASGTNYEFRVLAVNSTGSTPSNAVTATTLSAVSAPGAPALANPASVTANQANLSWTAPATGGPVVDYVVEYRTTAGPGAWVALPAVNSSNTSTIVTGLQPATGYDFRVLARNSGGSTPSNTVSATTLSALNLPGAPVLDAIGNQGLTSTTANLTWTAPASGGAVASYQIQYSLDGTSWTQSGSNQIPATTAYTVTGLAPATDYYFRVVAVNGTGSTASNVQTATTDSGNPCGSQLTGTTTLIFATGDIDISDFNAPNAVIYAPNGKVIVGESGPGKVTRVKMIVAQEVVFNGGQITAAESGDVISTTGDVRLVR